MSPTVIAPTAVAPVWGPSAIDDLDDDEDRYEVEFGQRVELPPMSVDAAEVAGELYRVMANFALERRLGRVFVESQFVFPMSDDPTKRYKPDVAFVSYDRRPADARTPPGAAALEVVPDLAVEVASPSDHTRRVRHKRRVYFTAGVRLLWEIDPITREAMVFTSPTDVRGLNDTQTLDGGDVLPGFRLPLADLFGPPAPPAG